MESTAPDLSRPGQVNARVLQFGGLGFEVYFRDSRGVTPRVSAVRGETWTELFRFDDFVNNPHYHSPATGPQIDLDRSVVGDPLAWYMAQLRDRLRELVIESGFEELLPGIDIDAVAANVDKLAEAMTECVPEGFVRVPGIGVQRTTASQ